MTTVCRTFCNVCEAEQQDEDPLTDHRWVVVSMGELSADICSTKCLKELAERLEPPAADPIEEPRP